MPLWRSHALLLCCADAATAPMPSPQQLKSMWQMLGVGFCPLPHAARTACVLSRSAGIASWLRPPTDSAANSDDDGAATTASALVGLNAPPATAPTRRNGASTSAGSQAFCHAVHSLSPCSTRIRCCAGPALGSLAVEAEDAAAPKKTQKAAGSRRGRPVGVRSAKPKKVIAPTLSSTRPRRARNAVDYVALAGGNSDEDSEGDGSDSSGGGAENGKRKNGAAAAAAAASKDDSDMGRDGHKVGADDVTGTGEASSKGKMQSRAKRSSGTAGGAAVETAPREEDVNTAAAAATPHDSSVPVAAKTRKRKPPPDEGCAVVPARRAGVVGCSPYSPASAVWCARECGAPQGRSVRTWRACGAC